MGIARLMGHMLLTRLDIKEDRTVRVATPSFRLMAVPGDVGEMVFMHVGNALFQVGVAVLVVSPNRGNQQG
ncbi:MAG: hypothetical protein B7Z35_10750 [Hydrogenophilales bacterium 12-61-10]|nr:MAG: hypothetical protein B7Z35_10750 [Hydrogenophilales bacterium 12-61-10]